MGALYVALVVAIIIVIVVQVSGADLIGNGKQRFCETGPYGMSLFDSPRYYPFYEGQAYVGAAPQCVPYCRAGGCAVVCR